MAYEIVIFSKWGREEGRYVPTDEEEILKEGMPEGTIWFHSISLQELCDISQLLDEMGLDDRRAFPSIADFEEKGISVSDSPKELYEQASKRLEKAKELLGWNEYCQKYVDGLAHREEIELKDEPAPGETVEELWHKTDMWMLLKQFLYHWKKGRYVFYNPPAR